MCISHKFPPFPHCKGGVREKWTAMVQPMSAESRQTQPEGLNSFLFPSSAFTREETKWSGNGVYILACRPRRGWLRSIWELCCFVLLCFPKATTNLDTEEFFLKCCLETLRLDKVNENGQNRASAVNQPPSLCVNAIQRGYRFCASFCTVENFFLTVETASDQSRFNWWGTSLKLRLNPLLRRCICPLPLMLNVYGPLIAPETQAAIVFRSAFFEAALGVAIATVLPS